MYPLKQEQLLLPATDHERGWHGKQDAADVLLSLGEYFPAAQGVQPPDPASALWPPAGHGRHGPPSGPE